MANKPVYCDECQSWADMRSEILRLAKKGKTLNGHALLPKKHWPTMEKSIKRDRQQRAEVTITVEGPGGKIVRGVCLLCYKHSDEPCATLEAIWNMDGLSWKKREKLAEQDR